ncbi:MAG: thioredoxin family protein [Chloroflexi bacterium]|nr:thioredoxin family protein [Chloroflexota bacterium]
MESPRVKADVVEVQEFPQIARAYGVSGVPKTVINDSVQFAGAVTEETLIRRIMEAVGQQEADEAGEEQVVGQTTALL